MAFNLKDYATLCKVADVDGFLCRCDSFFELLSEANSKMNLTRITTREDFDLKHVADSLSMLRFFPEFADKKLKIADVGCGAGFPSVILAAAFPDWQITAIDSTQKKIAFVSGAAEALDLDNLHPVAGRAIELSRRKEFSENFNVITARAVATAEKLFHECRRMVAPHGRFIFYKTPGQADEISAVNKAPGFRWHNLPEFELPGGGGTRLFMTGERR